MNKPSGSRTRGYFPKVREARQALADKALDLFNTYEAMIKEAIAAQNFEVASEALQFLILHMPKDPDGEGMIDNTIDAKVVEKGGGGPRINIGFSVGGLPERKGLPEPTIDVQAEETNE